VRSGNKPNQHSLKASFDPTKERTLNKVHQRARLNSRYPRKRTIRQNAIELLLNPRFA